MIRDWGVDRRSSGSAGLVTCLAVGVLLLLAAPAGAGASAPIHAFLPSLSHEGSFSRPCGTAADSDGDLYVADLSFSSGGSISVYGPGGGQITQLVPAANFAYPCGLAVDAAGDVYAESESDIVRYKPSEFPPTGLTTYEADTSLNGTGKLEVNFPTGVAVDPSSQDVYVSESAVDEEQVFSRPTTAQCGTSTTFTITYAPAGLTTSELPCSPTTNGNTPSAAAIRTALEAIVGSGTVSVSGAGVKTVTFTGSLSATNIPAQALEVRKGAGAEAGALLSKSTTAADGAKSRIASFDSAGVPLNTTIGGGLVSGAAYYGVDVDGDSGDIYVADVAHNLVYILNPAGTTILTTITGADSPEGAFTGMQQPELAVDQATGNVFVSDIPAHGVVDEFDSSGAYVSQLGPAFGNPPRTLSEAGPSAIAVDNTSGPGAGNVYVTSGEGTGSVYAFGPALSSQPPEAEVGAATDVTQTSAHLSANVNPNGDPAIACEFLWEEEGGGGAGSVACDPDPGSASTFAEVGGSATGLTPHATYLWKVKIETVAGTAESSGQSFVASAAPTASTESASGIAETEATLHGTVDPAGGVAASCRFEYDTSPYGSPAETPHGSVIACQPDPGSAVADTAVSASLTGLSPRTTYFYRLVESTDGGTARGEGLELTTTAPPQVVSEGARLGETSATLEAQIRPNGLPTSYRFQYVAEAVYERDVEELGPDHGFDHAEETAEGGSVGEDFSEHRAAADVSGLIGGTVYRYRALAISPAGTVTGAAARLMTLDEAGLPDGRGIEMVSPADLGPVGEVRPLGANQLAFQASADGDRIIYPILNGLASSTVGGQPDYLATSSAHGWSSVQLTPPASAAASGTGESSNIPGRLTQFSPDLGCGVVETFSPFPSDPAVPADGEGAENLFVARQGGVPSLITSARPSNPFLSTGRPGNFDVDAVSADCSTVLFETQYRYPEVAYTGLYEWSGGQLRNAGVLPGGATATGAKAGGINTKGSFANAVSDDGSTLFFSAKTSEAGHAPASLGVFARRNGAETVDVSRSATAVPDRNAVYQAASADGSRVFFLANYGLTSAPSNGATTAECKLGESNDECDLYEYDLDDEELHDLTATTAPGNPKGAVSAGLLGLSEDGSRVYLAAKGQLVPGRGNTYAENTAGSGSYNVYLSEEDPSHQRSLLFVGLFTASQSEDAESQLLTNPIELTSQVNPDGTALLFTSRANVTGYDSGGASEAYLYSRAAESTRCVSCLPDGAAPLPNPSGVRHIAKSPGWPYQAHFPRALSADGEAVVFGSVDVLAPGGVAGANNLYEWREGAVALLMTEPVGKSQTPFVDAGANGNDVFVATSEHLLPSARGTRTRLYDLRVAGGFPEPPEPQQPCDALAERACQGGEVSAPGQETPATPGYSGPGNPVAPKPRCRPGTLRRKGRCVARHNSGRRAHHKRARHHRHANTKGRAGR